MITPRTTRLVRTADLDVFRRTVVSLASEGAPLEARDRLVIVPTRAAAAFLTSALERQRLAALDAIVHPELITSRELPARFGERAVPALAPARPEAREVLMGVACRAAIDDGHPPPFALRPGLIAEVLAFYDALVRRRRDIATFERLALGRLEAGAEYDRGAERLVRQTRFLVAAFTAFERLSTERELVDDRLLRAVAIDTRASRPWRHAIVTVGDESRDRYGLCGADWDLLTRVPGLERLDVVVTDRSLAGAWHEHVHQLLPEIEEVRVETDGPPSSRVVRIPASGAGSWKPETTHRESLRIWNARDREEEVAGFARWTRSLHRDNPDVSLDRIALVVRQPLPYVYLTREVLRSANVPCQTFETLPLAAEPYAAAVDLVLSVVSTNVSRTAGVALLSSPHLEWSVDGEPVSPASIAAADALLSERAYLGSIEALQRIVDKARDGQRPGLATSALPALKALAAAASELESLRNEAPAGEHLNTILTFLIRHDAGVTGDDPQRSRRLRARAAIQGVIRVLRDDFRQLDSQPAGVDRVAAIIRRWIESHTFAPRIGDAGVHIVDAESAKFGEFDYVQLAGLADGEWPERPMRNIFYGTSLLRDLGWSSESEHVDQARGCFVDLLKLPAKVLTVSTFELEDDAIVPPSSLVDELDAVEYETLDANEDHARIFETEALGLEPVALAGMGEHECAAASRRLARPPMGDARFHGATKGHSVAAYSMSGLERYQDCPFKFFASDVLRLAEIPDDEPFLSPRARGRFIHEVFQRFFEAWDAQGTQTITVENMDGARTLFSEIAAPLLSALNESDAALEHARLFGSAIATGVVDVVLALEASRPAVVRERWLESRFDGEFSLGQQAGPRIPIRGVADRVDLLDGRELRVIDYKTGQAPDVNRALQVPVYAMCAQEQLRQRDGEDWSVAEASYVAFSGKRVLVPVIGAAAEVEPVLSAARERLLNAISGVTGGAFPPSPHDVMLCRSCAYPSVCRKDYVDAPR